MSSLHSHDQALADRADYSPEQDADESIDVFEISAKYSTRGNLWRWKKATLVLNATRRFRYTAEVHEAKRVERVSEIGASARAIKSVNLQAGEVFQFGSSDLNLNANKLMKLTQDRRYDSLNELGGVEGVARLLETNLTDGIPDDSEEVEKRRHALGSNLYPGKLPKSYFRFLWDACKDPALFILIVRTILFMGLDTKSHSIREGWCGGGSIAVAAFLLILVTSINNYMSYLQERNIQVQVMRGGRRQEISIFEVVCGDIVFLSIGDQVPADGLFVDGYSLFLDESSVTGESGPVHVHGRMPFLLSGSKVHAGHGSMLVTAVGMLPECGQLMAVIGEDNGEETPLQVRLNGMATFIGYGGMVVTVLVFVILLIFLFSGHMERANNNEKFEAGKTSSSDFANSLAEILLVARTMGSAVTICSDRTGTSALNQMNVVKLWAAGEFRDPVSDLQNFQDYHNHLPEGLAQNSSGSVFIPMEGEEPEVLGSPTEKAVLLWGLKLTQQSNILQVERFNSDKKQAGAAVQTPAPGRVNMHRKGAAKLIVDGCDQFLCLDSTNSITMEENSRLLHVIEGMAAENLYCIAFGYREVEVKDVPTREHLETGKVPECALTLLALIGIKVPCRHEIHVAVQQCQAAGIKV